MYLSMFDQQLAQGLSGRGVGLAEAMHAQLQQLIPHIARVEVCYAPGAAHVPTLPPDPRRKPSPGMLLDAARGRTPK